jgi:hypothetical protein
MGINAVLLSYQARLVGVHAGASQLRAGQMIAFVVMALAIGAVLILALFSMARPKLPWIYALFPLPIALYSARAGKKRNSALLKNLRLEEYYQRGVDRLEGKWAGIGPDGEEFARSGHSYDKDLHVVGGGSLFQLLCTCRTEVGRRRLAGFLLSPTTLEASVLRQQAVRELQQRSDLREQIGLLGEFSFQQSTWNTILEWLDSPVVRIRSPFRFLIFITSIGLGALLLLGFASVFTWSNLVPWIVGLLFLNAGLGLVYRTALLNSLPAIRAVAAELAVLREGLSLIRVQKFECPLLIQLAASSAESEAPRRIRKLERLMGALIERDKEWFYAISRSLLIGTLLFLAIEKWRSESRELMRRWLDSWGDFEALMALATYAYEHPENTFPALSESKTCFEAEGLGHPLLPADESVRNRVSLNEDIRFYVISGSNMAGKSTVLRTIGLNAVLAYAGAPVCAERLVLSRFSICASLSIQDSLLNGKSKFLAEIDRIRQALSGSPDQGPVLFLIDEILSGTNSKDRRTAAEAILRALIQRGAIGALSTHDLALTDLATLGDLHGANVNMGSKDDSDPMDFDYLLKPGVTCQSTAIAIAKLAGMPV